MPRLFWNSTSLCPQDSFPLIFTANQVAATVPVSSSSAEWSFSALKRIKSYFRSRMSEEQGSDLGALHVNCNILSLIDEVDKLSRYAEKNRRICLVQLLFLYTVSELFEIFLNYSNIIIHE